MVVTKQHVGGLLQWLPNVLSFVAGEFSFSCIKATVESVSCMLINVLDTVLCAARLTWLSPCWRLNCSEHVRVYPRRLDLLGATQQPLRLYLS